MLPIHTLGLHSVSAEFTYSGSVKEGVTIRFGSIDKIVSAEFFKAILNCFKGATILGSLSMTDSKPGGFGLWVELYSQQMNPVRLYARHASFIAAILENEGYITSTQQGNALMLRFSNDYEL